MLGLLLNILKIVIIVAVCFFVLTFTVYIFNLDMKLTAALQPLIDKWSEKLFKRDEHL